MKKNPSGQTVHIHGIKNDQIFSVAMEKFHIVILASLSSSFDCTGLITFVEVIKSIVNRCTNYFRCYQESL